MANINTNNTIATIIAYFLSKYNKRSLEILGYKNFSNCFKDLFIKLNLNSPDYLRLRMNEFDPFFPNNGRVGFNKREPVEFVKKIFYEMEKYSFKENTIKIKQLLNINKNIEIPEILQNEIKNFSEYEIENILNFEDKEAKIINTLSNSKKRILDTSIIIKLKEYYNFKCQICGKEYYTKYDCNIVEGHHIDYFSKSLNNNSSNIIIICPDHHRIIHKANPIFDKENKIFKYNNGLIEELKFNNHL